MTEGTRARLRQILLSRYKDWIGLLTRRLRSKDLAVEVLHDTYLRLEGAELKSVENPQAYLFQTAINVARDRQRFEERRAGINVRQEQLRSAQRQFEASEVDDAILLDAADETPGPAEVTEAASDLQALQRALASLSARRREIFEESFLREVPHRELAERLGISMRTVQMELKVAVEHCAAQLLRDGRAGAGKKDFVADPRQTSLKIRAVSADPPAGSSTRS